MSRLGVAELVYERAMRGRPNDTLAVQATYVGRCQRAASGARKSISEFIQSCIRDRFAGAKQRSCDGSTIAVSEEYKE